MELNNIDQPPVQNLNNNISIPSNRNIIEAVEQLRIAIQTSSSCTYWRDSGIDIDQDTRNFLLQWLTNDSRVSKIMAYSCMLQHWNGLNKMALTMIP